jgi:hypothetical protein
MQPLVTGGAPLTGLLCIKDEYQSLLGHIPLAVKSPIAVIFGALVVLALSGIGFVVWQFDRPPFPLSRLHQLHSGMSRHDVQKILGSPSDAWTRTNDSGEAYAEWAYSRPMSWPIVYIYFTPDGRFGSHRYDH